MSLINNTERINPKKETRSRDIIISISMCKSSDEFINMLFSLIFYLVVKRLIITKNSIVEIRNPVNHELRPVKSNLEE